jgi:hypothetical protein
MRETQFHSSRFVMHTFGDYAKFCTPGHQAVGHGTHGCTVFWDRTPCSLVDIYRRFGRTCCIYLQNLRNIGRHVRTPKDRSPHVRELRDADLGLTGFGLVQEVAAKDL